MMRLEEHAIGKIFKRSSITLSEIRIGLYLYIKTHRLKKHARPGGGEESHERIEQNLSVKVLGVMDTDRFPLAFMGEKFVV